MNPFFSASPLWQNNGVAIVRVIVGLLLVYHGKEVFEPGLMQGYSTWDSFKSSAAPVLMVYLGKGSELVAGILLTLGLFTRIACLIMIVTFTYITFVIAGGKFWYEDQHPFMFVLTGFMFFFTGPGNFCADAFIFRKKPNRY